MTVPEPHLAMMTLDEIIKLVETDLPGWDFLMRSNKNNDGKSDLPYFANIMTPDFEGHVILVPGGYIDASAGSRFIAYGETLAMALGKAYNNALDHFHAVEDAAAS